MFCGDRKYWLGNAATALAKMLNKRVNMDVPK